MKKILTIFILLMLIGTVSYAAEPNYTDGIMLIANSQDVIVEYGRHYGLSNLLKDTDGTLIKNGTAYAPLDMFSYLYSRYDTVTCENGIYSTKIFNRDLVIDAGYSEILFDGKTDKIDCFEKDGILYVPVRWFGENILDLAVVWNDGKILLCNKTLSDKNVEYTFKKYSEYAEEYSLGSEGWTTEVLRMESNNLNIGDNYSSYDSGTRQYDWFARTSCIVMDGYLPTIDLSSHSLGFLDSSLNFTKAVDADMDYYDITALMAPRCGWALVARDLATADEGFISEVGFYAYLKGDSFVDKDGNVLTVQFDEIVDDNYVAYESLRAVDEFYDGIALMTSKELSQDYDMLDRGKKDFNECLKRYIYFVNTDGELVGTINSNKYECSSETYDWDMYSTIGFGKYRFSNGLLPVHEKSTGKWGYVNKLGELAIECKFDSAKSFESGVADVELDGQKYCIDIYGNLTVPRANDKPFV